MSGFDDLNFAELRGEQNKPRAILRNSVLGAKNLECRNLVIKSFKKFDEIRKDGMALQFRDILHTDDIRPRHFDQPTKRSKQTPLVVGLRIKPLSILGKRLARSATHEDS